MKWRFEPEVRKGLGGANRRFKPVVSGSEMFTKRVAVRAVDLSIGAFCTEFRCEPLCDDDTFLDLGQVLDFFMLPFD